MQQNRLVMDIVLTDNYGGKRDTSLRVAKPVKEYALIGTKETLK